MTVVCDKRVDDDRVSESSVAAVSELCYLLVVGSWQWVRGVAIAHAGASGWLLLSARCRAYCCRRARHDSGECGSISSVTMACW